VKTVAVLEAGVRVLSPSPVTSWVGCPNFETLDWRPVIWDEIPLSVFSMLERSVSTVEKPDVTDVDTSVSVVDRPETAVLRPPRVPDRLVKLPFRSDCRVEKSEVIKPRDITCE
jgi:hypothetical protein